MNKKKKRERNASVIDELIDRTYETKIVRDEHYKSRAAALIRADETLDAAWFEMEDSFLTFLEDTYRKLLRRTIRNAVLGITMDDGLCLYEFMALLIRNYLTEGSEETSLSTAFYDMYPDNFRYDDDICIPDDMLPTVLTEGFSYPAEKTAELIRRLMEKR